MKTKIKSIFIPCQENDYRPNLLAGDTLFYYAILILVLKLSLLPFFLYFPKNIFFAEITKNALVQFVNQTRESSGLQLLKENQKLNQTAYLKANDMLQKNYFSHQSPEGIWTWDWLKKIGYHYRLAGENLAIGFLESEQVYSAWMDSPSHKANILNPNYQEIGIAVLKGKFGGSETTVVVQLFGSPKVLAKEIKKPETKKIEKPKTEVLPKPLEVPPAPVEETPIKETEVLSVPLETSPLTESAPLETPPLIESTESPSQPTDTPLSTEVISQTAVEETKKNFTFRFWNFIIFNYPHLVQKFIYGSLVLIIFLLVITVFCDIFIYRKFEIQYKDIVLKTMGFSILLLALLYLNKVRMIEFINPQNFMIH